MSRSHVLVLFLREYGKARRRNHLPEDALSPLLSCLLLIFDREVFAHESGRNFYNFDDFVLQNE